jgi:hypothetical protein
MVIVFVVGLVSPKRARQLQRQFKRQAQELDAFLDRLWAPFDKLMKKSVRFIHLALHKTAEFGKRLRHRLPF